MVARKKVIRFGIIGVGGMGQGHCSSIAKVSDAKLTAVCDIDAATAKDVGIRHGVPFFVDHRDLIKAGVCDAVIVATPHPVRPPIAIGCMKAGLHLLSEKPLAEAVGAADRMVRTAKRTGVAFAVMFQRRTEPVVAKAIQLVRSGRIGTLSRATLIFPDYRTQAYYDSGTWRATWEGEGGGVLLNQAPHILDILIQLAGLPVEVIGRTGIELHHIEVEDVAQAMLTYRGGATGYLYCTTNDLRPSEMIEIAGDKGKLIYRDGELRLFTYTSSIRRFTRSSDKMWSSPRVREVAVKIPRRVSGHFVIIRNFAQHVLSGEPLLSPGEEGLASLELANAIALSSCKKEAVKLPISRREYDAFLAKMRKTSTFKKRRRRTRRETDPQHR